MPVRAGTLLRTGGIQYVGGPPPHNRPPPCPAMAPVRSSPQLEPCVVRGRANWPCRHSLSRIAGIGTVPIRTRRQRTQPEQRRLVQHEPVVGGHRGQAVDLASCLRQIVGVTTLEQKLHELPIPIPLANMHDPPRRASRSLDRLAYGYAAAIRKGMLSNQHREPIGVRTGGRIAFHRAHPYACLRHRGEQESGQ